MPPAALLLSFLVTGLAPLVAAWPPPVQQPPARPAQQPPQAPADLTPSDPAAIGFLESAVDLRVYSLEAAGAGRVTADIHATVEGLQGLTTIAPVALDIELQCDLLSGSISLRPKGTLDEIGKQLLPIVYSNAQLASPILPSRVAVNFVVKFAQDGELIKLDYTPRTTGGLTRLLTEWYKLDGTPVRRRGEMVAPDGTKATQDAKPEFIELEGRLLLKSWKPSEGSTGATVEFEYGRSGKFHVLKRMVQRSEQTKVTLDFQVAVEPKA